MLVGMALAALTAKPLAQRFGKAEISAAGGFFAAAVCLGTFFLRPGSVWVYCVLQMLCWLGLGLFSMVNWALITDVIDYAELKNGVREDGTVYALYSFARKVGQSLAAGLSGWLLQRIGYSTAAAQAGQPQPSQVLAGMFNISTLVPLTLQTPTALLTKSEELNYGNYDPFRDFSGGEIQCRAKNI